jgi:hypothetical protein
LGAAIAYGVLFDGFRHYRPDMKVVVLHNQLVNFPAKRALSALTVFIVHLSDVPVATGNLHTDNGTVTQRIHPVIVVVFFCLVVHNNHSFTCFYIKLTIALVALADKTGQQPFIDIIYKFYYFSPSVSKNTFNNILFYGNRQDENFSRRNLLAVLFFTHR